MATRMLQSMSAVLSKHYLGEFKMRLGNITCNEMVRPLSQNGLKQLERSIKDAGWLDNFAPSVVIQRDRLGDSDKLTAEAALITPAHTLDGNHRVATLKKMFGEDGVFLVRVYLEFKQADERVIANALNNATENVVQRTLYDKVYFQHELEEAIKREIKKEKVTQADIRRMYERVGAVPPPKTTLRNWQLAVDALHPESFQVLKEVCESDEAEVDGAAVTLAFLTRKVFAEFSALQQGLCIHILGRFKYRNNRLPHSKDYEDIDKNAGIAASFVENVLNIVPRDDWTPELRREVNRLSHEKPTQLALFVEPHQEKHADEAKRLLARVSTGDQASSHVVQLKESISKVVPSTPFPRIRNILTKDPTLREHLMSWDAKYQDIINQVNLHKVHRGTGGGDGVNLTPNSGERRGRGGDEGGDRGGRGRDNDDEGASGDKDEGVGYEDFGGGDNVEGTGAGGGGGDLDGGLGGGGGGREDAPKRGWNKGICCQTCNPPPTARYLCIECSIIHMGECANANFITEEIAKERRCITCPRSLDSSKGAGEAEDEAGDVGKGKGKGKGKEASRGRVRPNLLIEPSGDEAVLMDKCRDENAMLHDILPLDPTRSDIHKLSFRNAPKLVIVSIGADQRLLQISKATTRHIGQVIHQVHGMMHPDGTIALVVPHPWSAHLYRIQEAVRGACVGLVFEDHPLMLHYSKRVEGRPAVRTENHLKNNLDMVVLLHNEEASFTCNKRVTVEDTFGFGTDASPSVQLMTDIEYEGAATDLVMRPLHFLINRYTHAGDTVASLSAERHNVVEGALDRGRRVEVFVADPQSKDQLREILRASFSQAYKAGKWKAYKSIAQEERVISPSCLPIGLEANLLPSEVQRCLDTTRKEKGSAMGEAEANLYVATHLAKDFGYSLESPEDSSSGSSEAFLLPQRDRDYHVNLLDLPAWGKLEVFNSRPEAFRSLSLDEQEDQRVRLLHVANNVQLKRMLVPGKEVCGPGAELYLRVGPTCPLYYMRWTNDVNQATIEFTSKVPQSGSRAEVLAPFSQVQGQAFVTPQVGRVVRARSKSDPRSPLNALPGFAVVRSQGFEVRESDSDSSSAAARKRKRPQRRATDGGRGKGRRLQNRADGSSPDESDDMEVEEDGDDNYEGEGEVEDKDDHLESEGDENGRDGVSWSNGGGGGPRESIPVKIECDEPLSYVSGFSQASVGFRLKEED